MPAKADNWLPTRRSLLQRLKHWDDQESWRDFFNTYSRIIYTVAARAGFDDAEAQDIVQETIIAVAKHMPDFHYDPAKGSFKAWLLRIVRHRIIDHQRMRQSHPQHQRQPPTGTTATSRTSTINKVPDPRSADLDRMWDEEWRQQLFDTALQRVKTKVGDTDFQIFDCYVLKQWPVNDVAATLSVSKAHVYVAKSRVSAALKKEIKAVEARML
jgi:RNA polymerase sigma-70 factor (ECF subfamily)